jgi:hypothetical protein
VIKEEESTVVAGVIDTVNVVRVNVTAPPADACAVELVPSRVTLNVPAAEKLENTPPALRTYASVIVSLTVTLKGTPALGAVNESKFAN